MRENPERFARNVLLAAFSVFLLLCGAAIFGAQWFIFQSQVPMDVSLTVSRGTVSVVPPDTEDAIAVTDRRDDLELGAIVSTDSNSQGLVSFRDPRTGRLVAEWVLHRGSSLTVNTALAPRFGLNNRPYTIVGTSRQGSTETLLFSTASRPTTFTVTTSHATALFNQSGHFMLDVSEEATTITSRQGLAEVTDQNQHQVTLNPDQQVFIDASGSEPELQEARRRLLVNGDFRLPDLAGWAPYTLGSDPQGEVSSVIFEGRPVILFDRPLESFADAQLDHGEVGLEQELDIPASDLTFLEVRTTFRVVEQSLSTCGFEGSECPLMVRMDYLDANGDEQGWIHGFYVTDNPTLEYPQRCASCAIDHERIVPDRWHTFESGNLMALLPAELKPVTITNLRFYASGHAFKVYVDEMELLAAP